MTTTYAYYPGCSLHSTATEYNDSLRKVFSKLSVELQEPQGWVCCGASAAHSADELLATALPAHSLLAIEDLGLKEVVVPCAACFQRFKMAAHEMQQSNRLEGWVEEALGKKYKYSVTVRHPVLFFSQLAGLALGLTPQEVGIQKHMVNPLPLLEKYNLI